MARKKTVKVRVTSAAHYDAANRTESHSGLFPWDSVVRPARRNQQLCKEPTTPPPPQRRHSIHLGFCYGSMKYISTYFKESNSDRSRLGI